MYNITVVCNGMYIINNLDIVYNITVHYMP